MRFALGFTTAKLSSRQRFGMNLIEFCNMEIRNTVGALPNKALDRGASAKTGFDGWRPSFRSTEHRGAVRANAFSSGGTVLC